MSRRRAFAAAVLLAFAASAAEREVYRGTAYALTLREDGARVFPSLTVGARTILFAYETHGLMRLDGRDVRFNGQAAHDLVVTPGDKGCRVSYAHTLVLAGTPEGAPADAVGVATVELDCHPDGIGVRVRITPSTPGRLALVYGTCAAQTLVPCDFARRWAGVTVWLRGLDGDLMRDTLPDEATFEPSRWRAAARNNGAVAFAADDGVLTLRAGRASAVSLSRYKGGCQADAYVRHPYGDSRVVPWREALECTYALAVNSDYLLRPAH